jgi:hypothetical protein
MANQLQVGDIVQLSTFKRFEEKKPSSQNLREGDMVVNISNPNFKSGEVVLLTHDDGSGCPYFGRNMDSRVCANMADFAPLSEFTAGGKAQAPVVTATMTVYSDGVKLNNDTIEFDGKSWTREELQNTVKRYQAILRRPVAVVPQKAVAAKTKTTKKQTKKTK